LPLDPVDPTASTLEIRFGAVRNASSTPLRETGAMRAIYLLVAAAILGLAGGYAWSAITRPNPTLQVPKAVIPKMVDAPQSAEDRQWESESKEKDDALVEQSAPDPTAVERSVYYAGCNEVRAAGKAPLHSGQPGYRPEMDGDGDGIACEPIHA
jgi:hypothetical protein